MRYLVWILRLAVFFVVLLFASRNTTPVDVGLFAGHVLQQVPLIVVMLGAFVLGMVFGLLVAALSVMRRQRENSRLRRELERSRAAAARAEEAANRPRIPEPAAPLAPL